MTRPDPDKERQLGLAIYLAASIHRDQTDKGGVCYMLHPLSVMLTDDGEYGDRDDMIVRVLHDALEDAGGPEVKSWLKLEIARNFPGYIAEALAAMTHKPKGEESYDEYIERVAANPLARRAKIRDLRHNMDARRLPLGDITGKDFERWDKYRRALVRLERKD